MNNKEVTYAVDFRAGRQGRRSNKAASSHLHPPVGETAGDAVPRIARLMALAIRFDGLVREERIHDYAQLARLGRVTRARMTQIMKLINLAPDIQEQILFLPWIKRLNERNLRPLVNLTDWEDQRRLFRTVRES